MRKLIFLLMFLVLTGCATVTREEFDLYKATSNQNFVIAQKAFNEILGRLASLEALTRESSQKSEQPRASLPASIEEPIKQP